MAEPTDPNPAQPASAPPPPPVINVGPGPEAEPSTLDLPPNIAAAIACIPLVGGLVFYLLEKRNSFVRFYAMQSIIVGGAWVFFCIVYSIASFILTPIPGIGFIFRMILWAIWMVVGIAFLV